MVNGIKYTLPALFIRQVCIPVRMAKTATETAAAGRDGVYWYSRNVNSGEVASPPVGEARGSSRCSNMAVIGKGVWACCLWKWNYFLKATWLLRRSYTEGKELQESSGIVKKSSPTQCIGTLSHHRDRHRKPAIDGRPSSITYLRAPLRIRSENCPAPLRTRSEKSFGG